VPPGPPVPVLALGAPLVVELLGIPVFFCCIAGAGAVVVEAAGGIHDEYNDDIRQLCSSLETPSAEQVRPRRSTNYFGLRGNGMNPSRFGIRTLGSDCASSTSFAPMMPLRLRT